MIVVQYILSCSFLLVSIDLPTPPLPAPSLDRYLYTFCDVHYYIPIYRA